MLPTFGLVSVPPPNWPQEIDVDSRDATDSDAEYAAENIVDGAFFNSGQSCCAIERVYVHESLYDAFVAEVVKVVNVSS